MPARSPSQPRRRTGLLRMTQMQPQMSKRRVYPYLEVGAAMRPCLLA